MKEVDLNIASDEPKTLTKEEIRFRHSAMEVAPALNPQLMDDLLRLQKSFHKEVVKLRRKYKVRIVDHISYSVENLEELKNQGAVNE